MEDLVSVLLPICNASDTLEDCVNSVLRQTHSNLELIAIDDGSDDRTPDILGEMSRWDARVKVFTFSSNRGIVAALNFGLECCSGDWIARMDADDVCHPDRIRTQREFFKRHPETDLLGTRIKLFRKQGELTPGQLRYQDWSNSLITDRQIKEEIFAESPIMHPTFFLRRSFFQKVGPYRSRVWPEDYDFIFRAYSMGATFAKVPKILLDKGDHPARLARTDPRCKRKPMFQAKAHFFAKTIKLSDKREVVILGSGSAAKMVRNALEVEGVTVSCFIDNHKGSKERTLCDIPVFGVDANEMKTLADTFSGALLLLCVGDPEGRERVENALRQRGARPINDYVRFI